MVEYRKEVFGQSLRFFVVERRNNYSTRHKLFHNHTMDHQMEMGPEQHTNSTLQPSSKI